MLNLVFADYVDPDNILAILASVQKERTAVVLTGRLASTDDNAPIDTGDFRHSVKLTCGAARWYKSFFSALGINLDFFMGVLHQKHLYHTESTPKKVTCLTVLTLQLCTHLNGFQHSKIS